MNIRTRHLTTSAMFMALAVFIPILTHAFGLGAALLPMFWPIAASVFFLPTAWAVLVAVLSPLVSTLLTGMPPISPPILQVMVVELAVLAAVSSLVYRHTRIRVFLSVLAGLVASRVALFFIVALLAPILGLPANVFSIAWVSRGIPGIVIMLVLIPVLVYRLPRFSPQ